MHNRQAEIAVLAVCGLFTCVAGLAAVSAGADKQAAECVPIVQKHGGLSVYQALGRTDAAVPPKRVEGQFGDMVLHDDQTITLSCRPHHRNAETSGFRQGMCRLHKGVLQDNGRFGRFDTQTVYGGLQGCRQVAKAACTFRQAIHRVVRMGQRCRPSGNGRSADSAACGKAPRPVLGDRAVHHGILGFAGRVVAREGPISQHASGYCTVLDMR